MNRYHCRTNRDEGRHKEWPTDFITCPRVGDYVRSRGGYELKVVTITHCVRASHCEGLPDHYIEVELNR
jgi:hypothetical protein